MLGHRAVDAALRLTAFACPRCTATIHPFVWVHGTPIDLVGMRETLAAIHYDVRVAEEILRALRREETRTAPIEPFLHVPTLVAHALVACLCSAPAPLPPWVWLGVVHPGVFGPLYFASRAVSSKRREAAREALITGSLSSSCFEPGAVPEVPENAYASHVVAALDLSDGWPDVAFGGLEAYRALGAVEKSTWSVVVDRRERLDKRRQDPVVLEPSEFVEGVVRHVVEAEHDSDTQTIPRRLTVVRSSELPTSTRYDYTPTLTVTSTSPRTRSAVVLNHVIETLNFSGGDVTWSWLRPQSRGPLTGVRWITFHRQCWGHGVFINGKHIDPDRELADAAERKAIAEALADRPTRFLMKMPVELRAFLASAMVISPLWFVTSQMFARTPLAGGFEWGARLIVATLLVAAIWIAHKRRKNPFPRSFWPDCDVSFAENQLRLTMAVRCRIQRAWGRLARRSPVPLSQVLGVLRPVDLLDREAAVFAVYCQDRLIQDAIAAVAEEHGIDVAKFREGVSHVTNYGVIAGNIDGPVATGASAKAEQKLYTNRGSKDAASQVETPAGGRMNELQKLEAELLALGASKEDIEKLRRAVQPILVHANYGVVANTVSGPIAIGAGAVANAGAPVSVGAERPREAGEKSRSFWLEATKLAGSASTATVAVSKIVELAAKFFS